MGYFTKKELTYKALLPDAIHAMLVWADGKANDKNRFSESASANNGKITIPNHFRWNKFNNYQYLSTSMGYPENHFSFR